MKKDISSDIQEIIKLQQEESDTSSHVEKQKENLRNKILRGGTTGDRITDLLVFAFGSIPVDQELGEKISNLEIEIKKHLNEQILIILMRETVTGCTGFGSNGNWGLKTEKYLGIIKEPFILFDLKNGSFIIEVTKYIIGNEYRYGTKPINESISLSLHMLLNLDKELPWKDRIEFSGNLNDLKESLKIIVGDKDVEMFHRLRDGLLFSKWKAGNISIGDVLDLGEGRDYVDVSYIDTLEILGKEIPKNLKQKYDKIIEKNQIELINNLEFLRKGSGILRDIKIILKKAFELDMHKTNLVIEEFPGVQIIVKKYIIEMCKKHKVNIPK